MEEVKLSFFAQLILYLKNPIQKCLDLINALSQIAGYEITIKDQFLFQSKHQKRKD
jgi:hypothetical protein